MNSENECPFFEVEQRLSDCLDLWAETKSNYFNPVIFRRSLNNCIQALRNVTWILQSNKSKFNNFDNWYIPWQKRMADDGIMRWLIDARNQIVKRGDLITRSKVRAAIVYRWKDPPVFETEVPVFAKTEHIARLLAKHTPNEQGWSVYLLKVERLWIDSKLPNKELLEALTHVFNVLSELVYDAHDKLSESAVSSLCLWYSGKVHKNVPSMLAQEWDRTMWFDLNEGVVMTPASIPFRTSEDSVKKALKRYPGMKVFSKNFKGSKTLEEESLVFFEQAKNILLKDGYHVPIAFIGYSGSELEVIPLIFRDRTEKHLIFLKLASDIEKKRATSLILISEAWIAPITDSIYFTRFEIKAAGRKEALMVTAAQADGKVITRGVVFSKNSLGKVSLGEETVFEGAGEESYLIPILAALKKNGA